ncbi:MAG: 50S ribosomal protein L25 [Patescibacteria group bacterium]
MVVELKAAKRTVRGKGVKELRESGMMPAVVYGPKQESTPIEVPLKEFAKALALAGESSVIALSVDGETHNVLVHDVDRDPLTETPRHADFYAIVKGQKVKINVPLSFRGEAPAVKELGANLIKALHELEVEADPMNLPRELVVDVSGLSALDMRIIASDISLPPGVALITKPDDVIATVIEAVEEKEPEPAPDIASIELSEERGKKPEEEGETGAAGADAAPPAEKKAEKK